MDELIYRVLNALFRTNYSRQPSKDEIADLIDRRLGASNEGADGKTINHARNGYRYYIIREIDKRRR